MSLRIEPPAFLSTLAVRHRSARERGWTVSPRMALVPPWEEYEAPEHQPSAPLPDVADGKPLVERRSSPGLAKPMPPVPRPEFTVCHRAGSASR